MAYCVRQYVMENVMFLEDVAQFRFYSTEKGMSWKKNKSQLLVKLYIQLNSEREVNISHDMRDRIFLRAKYCPSDLFDEAAVAVEVETMLREGTWIMFIKDQRRKARGSWVSALGL
jgi:hypothetical protein